MRVRKAEPADIPWLIAQLREFAALHPIGPRVMGSDDHCEALLAHLIETHYVAIAETDGTRVGLIAGAIAPHPFNPSLSVATELWWWVSPPARGSRAGSLLLAEYEAWANTADIKSFTLEADSPVHPKMLERLGYSLAETQYVGATA
jgi:N-acetylglutamate synthase-like GNAT family acetyltransferase